MSDYMYTLYNIPSYLSVTLEIPDLCPQSPGSPLGVVTLHV